MLRLLCLVLVSAAGCGWLRYEKVNPQQGGSGGNENSGELGNASNLPAPTNCELEPSTFQNEIGITGVIVRPRIGWNGSEYAVVWRDRVGEENAVRLQRISEDGQALNEPVNIITGDETLPFIYKIRWDGEGYGALLYSLPGSPARVGFMRFSPLGEILVPLKEISEVRRNSEPDTDLFWTGERYVWVGEDVLNRDMVAISMDREGENRRVIVLANEPSTPSLSATQIGSNFLAGYIQIEDGLHRCYIQMFDDNADLLGSAVRLTPNASYPDDLNCYAPTIHQISNERLGLTWFTEIDGQVDVFYQAFDNENFDGTSESISPLHAPTRVSNSAETSRHPVIIPTQEGVRILFVDYRLGPTKHFIASVNSTGTLIQEPTLFSDAEEHNLGKVFTGNGVAFSDRVGDTIRIASECID